MDIIGASAEGVRPQTPGDVRRGPVVERTIPVATAARVPAHRRAPGPARARPLIATFPFTRTSLTPADSWCGSANVARSASVAGSNTTISAQAPSRRTPRPDPVLLGGHPQDQHVLRFRYAAPAAGGGQLRANCRPDLGALSRSSPNTSVVTPWVSSPSDRGSCRTLTSEWLRMLMKPGHTALPAASTTAPASRGRPRPTAATRSPQTPTSAGTGPAPDPS